MGSRPFYFVSKNMLFYALYRTLYRNYLTNKMLSSHKNVKIHSQIAWQYNNVSKAIALK